MFEVCLKLSPSGVAIALETFSFFLISWFLAAIDHKDIFNVKVRNLICRKLSKELDAGDLAQQALVSTLAVPLRDDSIFYRIMQENTCRTFVLLGQTFSGFVGRDSIMLD